jgi:long-chain acyl-CoA synthetase
LDVQQRRWLTEGGWFLRLLGKWLFGLDRLIMTAMFDIEIHGVERIPPQGLCVITPNHTSLLDPLALITALPTNWLQRTCWGGWTGIMFRNPIMRLVSRATRVLPIN